MDIPLRILIQILNLKDDTISTHELYPIVSPRFANDDTPNWASLGNNYMWSWRELPPFRNEEARLSLKQPTQPNNFLVLQYSTHRSFLPKLTLCTCKDSKFFPIAAFEGNPDVPEGNFKTHKADLNNIKVSFSNPNAVDAVQAHKNGNFFQQGYSKELLNVLI